MEARTGIAVALLLVGCTQPQVSDENSEPIVVVAPTVAPQPASQQRDVPRRLKLRLTLDRPEDLKVKTGDWVDKGQVIGDRPSVRAKLIQEREALQQQLKQIQIQTVTPSYAVEQAEVEQARLNVEQARVAIARFQSNSPWTDYARETLPLAENKELSALEEKHQQQQAHLLIEIAHLQAAKTKRHMLQHETSAHQTELLRQIMSIEEQLSKLGLVQASYSGTIKSVNWLKQTNEGLLVELTLILRTNSN